MKKKLLFIPLIILAAFTACKKDKAPKDDEDKVPTEGTAFQKIQDSVFLYAKESYLWNTALPTYASFKPRDFDGKSDLSTLQAEVDALSQFAINPDTKKPFEFNESAEGESKYSFIDDGSTSGELGGQAGDFGFDVRYSIDGELYVKSVYLNSPAAAAGLRRGYKITSINDRTSLSQTNANISFLINALYNNDNIKLGLEKPDGSSFTADFNVGEYTINPVLAYKIITVGGKKVGYMVFDTFTAIENAKPKIAQAFNAFSAGSVTSLVIDLRYNGGGYTNTAAYLCDLMVPSAKNNALMYSYYFNENIQNAKCPIFNRKVFDNELKPGDLKPENPNAQIRFNKEGSLEVSKVVFIVTGSSASASELVINNMKPHLDVQLVGETSYGKPVGFYGTPFGKYDLYIPQFETKNSVGKGGYYAGMTPGSATYPGVYQYDDVTRDFGDENEWCLKQALNYITNNSFLPIIKSNMKRKAEVRSASVIREMGIQLSKPRFKGMILGKDELKVR
ncbi:hypothetical protein EOD41_03130 [Mucilaginibacter limnophilus]|uniref:PDZ domain-containing protein n=1 Tax=Mucilaginibacter limnophilus TaxID=1932778 RepID=A0A437MZC2_9SPHI|nr:S41 family peptidase [Mucilaginibacter limnophilus]RVU02944.1 hypothetical protein EOD41_03130 [Mucilaginibacter limnophilus]